MIRIFGIPNCDTVKKALSFLEKKKVEVEFIDFKKYRPTLSDIERWSVTFGGLPVNTKGTTYKKFKEEFESLSQDERKVFLQEHTSMIKRPVVEQDGKVLVFGFDEAQYNTFFG